MRELASVVRAAGGLMIADEVQTGLGRTGNTMWAFEEQEYTPVSTYVCTCEPADIFAQHNHSFAILVKPFHIGKRIDSFGRVDV